MPISLPECAIMAEEAMVCDVLHRFVSIPEQTYEQFLGTFIHPPKERQDEKSQPHSLPEQFCAPQGMDTRDWTEDSDIGSVVNLDESEQDQIVIDDGIKVGGYHCVDLAYPAKVQVDNYLDLSDLDTDQDNNEGLFTNHEQHDCPDESQRGKIFSEQKGKPEKPAKGGKGFPYTHSKKIVPCCICLVPEPDSTSEVRLTPQRDSTEILAKRDLCTCIIRPFMYSTMQLPLWQITGCRDKDGWLESTAPTSPRCLHCHVEEQRDDVQPFTLEEGFDYDHVALTPKFSESELKILETERNREIENTEHGQNHNL